jgi:limonene-1,2-epoxide hydrolase
MSTPIEVVTEFCELIGKKDRDTIRTLFDDEIVYHNNGLPAARGIEQALGAVQAQFDMFDPIAFKIVHIAADGDFVLTERIDEITAGGQFAPVPVSGTFLVRGGKIVHWRDYFDSGLVAKLMAGEDTSALMFSYE